MSADLVTRPGSDSVQGALEAAIGERLDPSAVVADQMVMVLPARQQRLVPRGIGEVEPLNEAQGYELVEGPVDARRSDPAARAAEPVDDLVCGQAAVLLGQERDHELSRAARAPAGDCEPRARVCFPVGGGHDQVV